MRSGSNLKRLRPGVRVDVDDREEGVTGREKVVGALPGQGDARL